MPVAPRTNRSSRPSGGARSSRGPGGAGSRGPRDRRPGGRGGRFFQKKICRLCAEGLQYVDFKDVERLRRYLTEKGKILPRRITGNCSKCQRHLARAIKRARHSAFIAFQID